MSENKSNNFELTLKHLFLLKDCYELISETIEEDIDLSTWDIEQRQSMLVAIDEIMDAVKEGMPKFAVRMRPNLKLVERSELEEE